MLYTIRRALFFYREHPEIWRKLQTRAMAGDYNWSRSAADYEALYETALADCRQPAPQSAARRPGRVCERRPAGSARDPSQPEAKASPAEPAPAAPTAPKKAPAKRAPRKARPQETRRTARPSPSAPPQKPAPKGEA